MKIEEISFPGDFRSWESTQTLPALFIGPFVDVEVDRDWWRPTFGDSQESPGLPITIK